MKPLQYKGISLLLKTSAFKNSGSQPTWRLLGGYYQEKLSPSPFGYRRGDTLTHKDYTHAMKYNYFVYAGLEFQKNKKRWRFYMGPDVGYRYSFSHLDHINTTTVFGADTILKTETYRTKGVTHSPRITIFGGTQFFFTPHLSLGLELNVDAGVEFVRIWSDIEDTKSYSNHWNFNYDFRLFRLFYLSYHFGREQEMMPADTGMK